MLDQRQGVMPDRRQGAFGPTRRPDGLDFAPPGPDRDFLPPPQVPPDVGQATLHPNFQHVQPGGRSNKRRP
jgi:hypothetical protein